MKHPRDGCNLDGNDEAPDRQLFLSYPTAAIVMSIVELIAAAGHSRDVSYGIARLKKDSSIDNRAVIVTSAERGMGFGGGMQGNRKTVPRSYGQ